MAGVFQLPTLFHRTLGFRCHGWNCNDACDVEKLKLRNKKKMMKGLWTERPRDWQRSGLPLSSASHLPTPRQVACRICVCSSVVALTHPT